MLHYHYTYLLTKPQHCNYVVKLYKITWSKIANFGKVFIKILTIMKFSIRGPEAPNNPLKNPKIC